MTSDEAREIYTTAVQLAKLTISFLPPPMVDETLDSWGVPEALRALGPPDAKAVTRLLHHLKDGFWDALAEEAEK